MIDPGNADPRVRSRKGSRSLIPALLCCGRPSDRTAAGGRVVVETRRARGACELVGGRHTFFVAFSSPRLAWRPPCTVLSLTAVSALQFVQTSMDLILKAAVVLAHVLARSRRIDSFPISLLCSALLVVVLHGTIRIAHELYISSLFFTGTY
jgi:hypothetical protein